MVVARVQANSFDSKTVKERKLRKKVIAKKRRASEAGQRRWSIIRAMKKAPATVVGRRSSNIAPLPVAEGQPPGALRRASVVSQSDDISMHISGAVDNNHEASSKGNNNEDDLLATMAMARKHRRSSAFQRAVQIPSDYQSEQPQPSRRASSAWVAGQVEAQATASASDTATLVPGVHIAIGRTGNHLHDWFHCFVRPATWYSYPQQACQCDRKRGCDIVSSITAAIR
jgi:hypothetical protein